MPRTALSTASAATVNLLQMILHKFYGYEISIVTQELHLAEMLREAAAVLMIGDEAIQAASKEKARQDNGPRICYAQTRFG
ncbi:MqnA/MqnD/SBP family protein [Brevibacillus sp. GCM10020057]|uniref:MqnA/MqnD/SBP family protein n=1 Tax=Brevibacillus sp. GCM10020057 TaxID=3317327 RepID=UPI003638647A